MSIHYIYILRCPDTRAVRYVGITTHPAIREKEHCIYAINKPKTKVQCWLIELRQQNKAPIFEVVESGERMGGRERMWIYFLHEAGADLLNVHMNKRTP